MSSVDNTVQTLSSLVRKFGQLKFRPTLRPVNLIELQWKRLKISGIDIETTVFFRCLKMGLIYCIVPSLKVG